MKRDLFYGVGVGLDDECGRIEKRMKTFSHPPSNAKNKSIQVHSYASKSHAWQARYLFIVF